MSIDVMPMISTGDYPEFDNMMGLPRTHAAWLRLHEDRRKEREAKGYEVQVVPVSPKEFRAYLLNHAQGATEAHLRQCAFDKALRLRSGANDNQFEGFTGNR